MASEDYLKAQKLGLKDYKYSTATGKHPYLPVLDEILSLVNIEYEVKLGVEDIPLNQVVGTSTFGRTRAFASNFMPLLEGSSEFAAKWTILARSQEKEGIRDPIKVYEYLNHYYVIEGNKRVSVLKYFDAATIRAEVIRKVPKKTDAPENRIYYEFLDFYKVSKLNYVLFTNPGSYKKLLEALGKESDQEWTVDDRRDFAAFFSDFEKAFSEKGGDRLSLTVSDAMLFFLSLYTYQEAKDMYIDDLRKHMENIWPDIILLAKEDSVELSMNPAAEKKAGTMESMLMKIIPPRKKMVAFIYDKDPSTSDWIYGHELGRIHLDEIYGDTVDTCTYFIKDADSDQEAAAVFEDICADGCDIVFVVTPKLIKACLKAAIEHPEMIILNCALNSSHSAVRTYYTRMYEAKFLTGMIAGSLCRNDKIGYVADYPLYGAAASINAFALGAKMVNPHAKVYLAWSTVKDFDVDAYFGKEQIEYISSQDMITPQNDNRQFGLYEITGNGKVNLALSIYQWGTFYERIVQSILNGSFKSEEAGENKAINYWWGLSAGVIDVICSQNLPTGTTKLIELMKQNISSGTFHPFTGPLFDQDGILRCETSGFFKPEDIMKMDWLSDNVVGYIPTLDDLKDEAKPVVELRGLYKTTSDKGGSSLL